MRVLEVKRKRHFLEFVKIKIRNRLRARHFTNNTSDLYYQVSNSVLLGM